MDLIEVIKKRRSIRKYKSKPVPPAVLARILEAGRLAPSAKNVQPWRFIVIKDEKTKRELAKACNCQWFIAQAPIVICGVALAQSAYARMGGYMSSFSVDLAIAMDHIILVATGEGLGTCWIGAFTEKRVKDILKVPESARIVALTPIGYPAERVAATSRKRLSKIVSYEKF